MEGKRHDVSAPLSEALYFVTLRSNGFIMAVKKL
jgi:hypothetical protein